MKKNEKPSLVKGKGAAAGIVLCFVAVIAMAGAYTFKSYQSQLEEQAAEAQRQAAALTEDTEKEANTNDIILPETEDENADSTEPLSGTDRTGTLSETAQNTPDESEQESEIQDGETSETSASGVWFDEESTLAWPASGAVLIGYSMDQTVFFQTLEQYKYNPALIISGETGETISASASGIVTKIEENAQTGTTVTLDMGNGYSAVYGQLKDLSVSEGDYVEVGNSIGLLSEPTKYYSVEGTNLYFAVEKDGEPVNPLNFME